MKIEFYIARRLSSRKGGARSGIMERVATVATALSLAVIIVALAVVVGFKVEMDRLMRGAVADVVVTAPQSRGMLSSVGLERGGRLEELISSDEVEHYSVYRAKEGVIKSSENIVGVLLKGVDEAYDLSFYAEHLLEGELPRIGEQPRTKDILLSEYVARRMDVGVGERVEMVFLDDGGTILRDRFSVVGIYTTGVDVIDHSFTLTDIGNVARLYDGDAGIVTGYELWLDKGVDAEQYAEELNADFVDLYLEEGTDAEAFTLFTLFPNIFGWLATMDVNGVVIVVIMIIVALLNMVTSLLIIVLERQRMIGELRAMGVSRRSVVGIFFFRSLFILCRGVAYGAIIGIAIVLIQHTWGVVPLPSEGYLLSIVPTALCWWLWLAAIVVVIIVTMSVLMLPALFAARISPSETMKYE